MQGEVICCNITPASGLFVSTLKIFYKKFAIFSQIFSARRFFNGSNHRIIQQKINQIDVQNTIVIVPGFADVIPDNDLGK